MHDAILGLIAAVVAVLTVHEATVAVLHRIGCTSARAYNMDPVKPLGVPTILNRVFWGGVWGVVYTLVVPALPDIAAWAQGMLFGWLVFLLVNCFFLPILRDEPIFYGFDPVRMASGFVILSLFGMALGVLYSWLGGS